MSNSLNDALKDFKQQASSSNIKIHGKEYATVPLRLAIARKHFGTKLDLKSEVIFHDEKRVVVQAHIYIDGQHVADGLAEEIRSSTFINKTSALENAQTSAWGRALASLGLHMDMIASAEEVSSAVEQQSKDLTSALEELSKVSHGGSYQEWLNKYKTKMQEMKSKNPPAYEKFKEEFAIQKKSLEKKGVNLNG